MNKHNNQPRRLSPRELREITAEAERLNVAIPVAGTIEDLSRAVCKALEAERKMNAEALAKSRLWADNVFSGLIKKYKLSEKAGLQVTETEKRTGLYSFTTEHELKKSKYVIVEEDGILVVRNEDDIDNNWSPSRQWKSWLKDVLTEVMTEVQEHPLRLHGGHVHLSRLTRQMMGIEEDYDRLQKFAPVRPRKGRRRNTEMKRDRDDRVSKSTSPSSTTRPVPANVQKPKAEEPKPQPVSLLDEKQVSRRQW